jgi:hypothetical protein
VHAIEDGSEVVPCVPAGEDVRPLLLDGKSSVKSAPHAKKYGPVCLLRRTVLLIAAGCTFGTRAKLHRKAAVLTQRVYCT